MEKANKEVTVKEANEKAQKSSEQCCVEGIIKEAVKLYRQQTHSVQQLLAYVRQLDKSDALKELLEEFEEESDDDNKGDDNKGDDDQTPAEPTAAQLKMLELVTEDELEMLKSGKFDEQIAELQKHEDYEEFTKEFLIEALEDKLKVAKELADKAAADKLAADNKNKGNQKNNKKK